MISEFFRTHFEKKGAEVQNIQIRNNVEYNYNLRGELTSVQHCVEVDVFLVGLGHYGDEQLYSKVETLLGNGSSADVEFTLMDQSKSISSPIAPNISLTYRARGLAL